MSLGLELEEKSKRPYTTVDHRTIDSYTELSISGNIRNGGGGQIQDEIRSGLDEYAIPKENFDRIIEIWDAYHLNGMNAGCIHQGSIKASANNWTELAAVETAKCPEGYGYGSSWLVREVPQGVIEEIEALFEGEEVIPEDKLIKEATDSYEESIDGEVRIYEIPSYNLVIKLRFEDEKRAKVGFYYEYSVEVTDEANNETIHFKFSDSVHNNQNKEILHDELIGDILGCVKSDYFYDEERFPSFKDFCDEFGYNNDSIKDKELYEEVIEHAVKLQKVFTEELVMTFQD